MDKTNYFHATSTNGSAEISNNPCLLALLVSRALSKSGEYGDGGGRAVPSPD